MARGTPGFVGGRLREGREARGLTASSLADLIGVTRAAVSQYENGIQSPAPEVMQRICLCLNLPERFFLRPMTAIPTGTIYYRSLSNLTKASRGKAEKCYLWVRTIAGYLARFVEFPAVNFPRYEIPKELRHLTMDRIESIALEARKSWKLSEMPIPNVTRLLEHNGVIVACDYFDTPSLDAFSEWSPSENRPYIMFSMDKSSAVRIRTDLAHELGHLLLHREVNRSLLSKPADLRLLEDQAFAFARAFLLPANSFAEDLYSLSLDGLAVLKRRWKVAIALMIKRAEDLELLTEEQARRLWVNRTRRGWRTQEPLDDELEIEKPCLLSNAMELLVDANEQNKDEILWNLPYAVNDFARFTGIQPTLLGDPPTPIAIGDAQRGSTPERTIFSTADGQIIPFPRNHPPNG